jgi:hypothetical protein
MTEKAKEIFGEPPQTSENIRISGGGALKPGRGRPAERKIPGSRDSSPNPGMILRPLTDEERRVMNTFVRQDIMTKEEYIRDLRAVKGD